MKRQGFIDYDGRNASRVTRVEFGRPPISAGVICSGDGIDVVLELEVRADGQWELSSRQYGHQAWVLAEGNVREKEEA